MSARTRPLVVAGTLAVLGLLAAGCGDDAPSTDQVEVEVGEEFTWNDFTVEEGWELSPVERAAGIDEIVSPEVTGTVVNDSEETRFALFSVAFLESGDVVAEVSCSSMELVQDQSAPLTCPGFGQTMPLDYDEVVVREITRDGADTETDGKA